MTVRHKPWRKYRLDVSCHAVVRYLERREDLQEVVRRVRQEIGKDATDYEIVEFIRLSESGKEAIERIRKHLGGGIIYEAYHALGKGNYPVSDGFVVVDNANVITFKNARR